MPLLIRIHTSNSGHVHRRREIANDRVQQQLDTLILERGSTHDGDHPALNTPFAQSSVEQIRRNLLLCQEQLHNAVVNLSDTFECHFAELSGFLNQFGGNIARFELRTKGFLIPYQ